MLLRTLEVPDAQGQLLNAVLLCGFTAKDIDRQFLVYSLNEKLVDDLVKIYLAPIEGAGSKLSMCSASSDVMTHAANVLKDIIRDACGPQPRPSESTYGVLDLTDVEIQCTAVHTHHSLKISEAWLMKLLAFNPQAPVGLPPQPQPQSQADAHVKPTDYQTLPTQTFLNPSASSIALPYRVVRATSSTVEVSVESHIPTEPAPSHSEKIETNLKSLIASVTQHKETLLGRFVKLEERLREVELREQNLEVRERSLIGREADLIASMNALQRAEEQLSVLMRDA